MRNPTPSLFILYSCRLFIILFIFHPAAAPAEGAAPAAETPAAAPAAEAPAAEAPAPAAEGAAPAPEAK